LNKTEMLTLLEVRLGGRAAAVAALDAVLDEITHAVASGERVTLTGFGTFERVERPARIGRNLRTGTAIEIPAAAAPRFHAGSVLKAAVAEPGPTLRARAVRTTSGTTARAAKAAAAAPAKAAAKAPAKATKVAAPAPKVKAAKAPKPDKKSSSGKKSASGKAGGSKKKKK